MKNNNLLSLLIILAIGLGISCGDEVDKKEIKTSLLGSWTATFFETSKCDTVIFEIAEELPCDDQDCLTLVFSDSSYTFITKEGGRTSNEGGKFSFTEDVIVFRFEDEQGEVRNTVSYNLSAQRIDSLRTSTLILTDNNDATGCREQTTYVKTDVVE